MSSDWRRIFPNRRNLFVGGGAVLFGGLALRLGHLQLLQGEEFKKEAEENQIRLLPAPAHRGTIFDRAGRVLAGSKRNFYVTIRPDKVDSVRDIAEVIERLGKILPLSESRKRSILQDATRQAAFLDILVADDLTWEEFSRVNVMAPELKGVSAEVGELRSYPFVGSFYHTIGYVQKANDKDVARIVEAELTAQKLDPASEDGRTRAATIRRLYRHPEMRVGKQGIEHYAESALKGEPGKIRVLQNANGRVIQRLPSDDIAGKPGTDLVLTLDAELQNYAISRFGAESGSAVVIDIKTGDVLCMMSTPAPDPNAFVSGIGSAAYSALRNDEKIPLVHKAYDGIYPPGSTFKIVVAAAALEAGVSPSDSVNCSGKAWYYNRYYNCWRPQGHGRMDLHRGIQHSCDCYFYAMAERIGIEKIAEVGKKFGLMHRYELGLSNGKAGVMPNNEWKLNNPRIKEKWYAGDTISAAIGQGYVLTTPFELAVMTARIAGGHKTPDPHLVASGVFVPDQTIQHLDGIKEDTLERVRAGMFAVTSEPGGTALRFGALDEKNELPAPYTGARMAGKSGTAQVRKIEASERDRTGKALGNEHFAWRLRDHALFVAYAPADNPRYAVAIVVEHGGSGSNVAAPFAKDLLTHCLKFDPGAKPHYTPAKEVAATTPAAERT